MNEKNRGSRCVGHHSDYIGEASASQQLKKLHASEGKGMSLKAFARKLAKDGNEVAQAWFDHKSGSLNQERSEENKKLATLCASSTKSAKKSKKKGGGSPPKTG